MGSRFCSGNRGPADPVSEIACQNVKIFFGRLDRQSHRDLPSVSAMTFALNTVAWLNIMSHSLVYVQGCRSTQG